jgi:chromosome segregation ATPase
MLNGISTILKKAWDDYLKPFVVCSLIACAFFGLGAIVGGHSRSTGDPDTELAGAGAELDAERQRVIQLEGAVTELTSRNNQLQEHINRAIAIAGEIDQSIGRLETLSGNMAQKLRGIITALQDIQRALRSFNDSINIGGSSGDS